jgi:hypothetical protein
MKKLIYLAFAALTALAACSSSQEEPIIDDGRPAYSIMVDGAIENGSISVKKSAKEGDTITITAQPAALTPEQEEAEAKEHPWRVKTITGTYGDGETLRGIRKTALNTYSFKMPAGDVELSAEFTQEVDSDNAEILGIYASAGTVKKTGELYEVEIPYGINGVYISAQCEEINAVPVLTSEAEGLLVLEDYDGENLLGINFTVPAGLSEFLLTVTSANGETVKPYTITVSQWPDLTLKSLTVSNEAADFLRELDPALESQALNVPLCDETLRTFMITAVPSGDENLQDVTVSVPIPKLITPYNGKLTLSRTISGRPYAKDYTVRLTMSDDPNFPLNPMADGGYVTFVKDGDDYYEIHRFTQLGAGTLSFIQNVPTGLSARVLVVAGGGGGGGGSSYAVYGGGGGAGGVVYEEAFPISQKNTPVSVGDGGNNGVQANDGKDGENSTFSSITAYGGGGGGAGPGWGLPEPNDGRPGGSGGGGGGDWTTGTIVLSSGGACTAPGQGTAGAAPENSGTSTEGGRGGGLAFQTDITGEELVYGVGGSGRGSAGAANTGNGGGGKDGNGDTARSKGGSGIVVVRFKFTSATP